MVVNSRFIFIHNPKTAGTSITKALGGQIEDQQNLPLFRVDRKGRFAFGFVRNPWARMVSFYHYAAKNYSVKASFKAWLTTMNHHLRADSIAFKPLQRRPQMWWLHGCDFIGRFENLEADFAHIVEQIGWEPRPLPHINQSGHGNWRREYDDVTRAFVQENFAQDIARFGYSFDERAN